MNPVRLQYTAPHRHDTGGVELTEVQGSIDPIAPLGKTLRSSERQMMPQT